MFPCWNKNLLSNFRTKLFSLSTPRNEYCSKNSLWLGTTQRKIEIFFDAKTSSCLSCLHVMSLSKCMRKLPIQQWLVFKWRIYIKNRVYRNRYNNKYVSEYKSWIQFRGTPSSIKQSIFRPKDRLRSAKSIDDSSFCWVINWVKGNAFFWYDFPIQKRWYLPPSKKINLEQNSTNMSFQFTFPQC